MVYEAGIVYEISSIQEHMAAGYQTNFQGVEHANTMQNFNFHRQNNPYSNAYNLG